MLKIKILTAGLISLLLGCNTKKENTDNLNISWQEIEAKAKGASITMMMFQGDRKVNKYMNEYVVPTIKEKYGITLTIVPGQSINLAKLKKSFTIDPA